MRSIEIITWVRSDGTVLVFRPRGQHIECGTDPDDAYEAWGDLFEQARSDVTELSDRKGG